MSTSTPTLTLSQRLELIKKFETLLDEIIVVQKEEQEAILNRQVQKLPELSGKIADYSAKLSKMRFDMAEVRPRPSEVDSTESSLRTVSMQKFQKMQELAHQNHLLLENCLRFLARVMTEFVGAQKRPTVYNQSGTLGNAFAQSGIMVDLKA